MITLVRQSKKYSNKTVDIKPSLIFQAAILASKWQVIKLAEILLACI